MCVSQVRVWLLDNGKEESVYNRKNIFKVAHKVAVNKGCFYIGILAKLDQSKVAIFVCTIDCPRRNSANLLKFVYSYTCWFA